VIIELKRLWFNEINVNKFKVKTLIEESMNACMSIVAYDLLLMNCNSVVML